MRSAVALLIAVPLAGCGMPDTPAPGDAARDGVARQSYAVPGTPLAVSILAKGDPNGRRVIFVHGTPGSADGWERFLRDPPRGVRMIAVDRPGFGETTPATAAVSLKEQAAAIAPLLAERHGRWPILVGHSLGGPIVAQVALDNPGKVDSLLILAGSFDPGLEHIYAVQRLGEWPIVRSVLPTAMRNANLELMALNPELEALAPRLSSLGCRVSVVHGTKDTNVPYANVAFLRSRLPARQLSVTTLEGRNHFIPWEAQDVVQRTLAGLLAGSGKPC